MPVELNDHLLTHSRRLDWRFVFADPRLQSVVVAGQPDDELLRSLQVLSVRLSIWEEQSTSDCDMLVLHNPSVSLFRRALEMVRPARFYLEFEGQNLNTRMRWMINSALCIRTAKRLSYGNVRSFWHWPNIASANRIIPLSQPEALSFVLTRGRNDIRTTLFMSGLRIVVGTGLVAPAINGLGIAGERLM